MSQIENLKPQLIDDDSLIRIFSFIPPIPFFFMTMPLINKQLFQYFFNFVTTCPIEELNYFREVNFWEFDCSLREPEKKEHIRVLANHYRLLFGEKNNIFFNTIQKRILETTETIFLPRWKDIAEQINDSQLLTKFKNLKTIFVPSVYQESSYESRIKKTAARTSEQTQKKDENMKFQQSFIFLNWNISIVQSFFRKYFNAIELGSKNDKSQKIPQIDKIVLVDMDNRTAATEETRKKFQNSNFFFKTTQYEALLNSESDTPSGTKEKDHKHENSLKNNLELEEFKNYSGLKKQTLENLPEVHFFNFSIKNKQDQRLLALLDYLGIKRPQIPLPAIMSDLGVQVDKLKFWLSEHFLDGWTTLARRMIKDESAFFDSDALDEKSSIVIDSEDFFGEIFSSFKKKSNISGAEHIKLVKMGQPIVNDETMVLYDYNDFVNDRGLSVANDYSDSLTMIVKSMQWDILRISFLKKNLDSLIENSRVIGKEAENAKRTLKNLRKLWKTCFLATDFGKWMMEFDHVMIFKLWEKLDTDLVRKIFRNAKLHFLIPFLLDSGEPDNSPNFPGKLNTPSPKTGELPIEILINKNPYYATAIVDGKLNPITETSKPENFEQKQLLFRVKRVANSNQINAKYIITKMIQSGQTRKIPFDLIHEGMESFSIEDIVPSLENQIPPQIYEMSKTKATFEQSNLKIIPIFMVSSTKFGSCLNNLDNDKVFSSHFNELEFELNRMISAFEEMFQNLMKSAHILKNMFDTQKEAKTGTKHSISTFLNGIVNESLDLFPQLPRKQKVSFLEFKMDDSSFRDRPRIESSEYVQKTFRDIMKIAAKSFQPLYKDGTIGEDLIDLALTIQEKHSITTSDEYLSELLASLMSIQQYFKSEKKREICFKNISTGKLSQILKDSKLHNQLLKNISETRQNLDKLLREDQKQQIYHTILLKIFKLLFDLEYYHLQIAGDDYKMSDVELLMAHFFASNTEKSNPNMEPFQFEEEENNTQDQKKLDDNDEKLFDCETYFFRKYSKDFSRSGDETEIILLINPHHKINSEQSETQKEARLNNCICHSLILKNLSFDFEVFEKFPNMKLFPQEIEILRLADRSREILFMHFMEARHTGRSKQIADFSERMNAALKKICPGESDSKKRKKESNDCEEQDENSPKRRKLEKNDELED